MESYAREYEKNKPNYYKTMGVKCDEGICSKCKNPVNYTLRIIKIADRQTKNNRKTFNKE